MTNSAPLARIVIASTVGLYWCDRHRCRVWIYAWTPVTTMADGMLPFPAVYYSSVAVGAGDRIIAAGAGKIFWGDWSGQGLLMERCGRAIRTHAVP